MYLLNMNRYVVHGDRPASSLNVSQSHKFPQTIVRCDKTPSSNEFQRVNFPALKTLIDAEGCLDGRNSALIYQKLWCVSQEIEYHTCDLLKMC